MCPWDANSKRGNSWWIQSLAALQWGTQSVGEIPSGRRKILLRINDWLKESTWREQWIFKDDGDTFLIIIPPQISYIPEKYPTIPILTLAESVCIYLSFVSLLYSKPPVVLLKVFLYFIPWLDLSPWLIFKLVTISDALFNPLCSFLNIWYLFWISSSHLCVTQVLVWFCLFPPGQVEKYMQIYSKFWRSQVLRKVSPLRPVQLEKDKTKLKPVWHIYLYLYI